MMVGWMGEERDTVSGNGWVVSNKRPSITQGTQDTHVAPRHLIHISLYLPPSHPPVSPRLSLVLTTMQSRNKFDQPKNIAVPNQISLF